MIGNVRAQEVQTNWPSAIVPLFRADEDTSTRNGELHSVHANHSVNLGSIFLRLLPAFISWTARPHHNRSARDVSNSAMRSPEWPSPNGFTECASCRFLFCASHSFAVSTIIFRDEPTSFAQPDSIASGRSVISRNTTTGLLFFFNDTATTEIYTLSLHDALPI